MLPPAKRVKATTYRRDSREVAKFCVRLIAETDARSVGDSHPSYFPVISSHDSAIVRQVWSSRVVDDTIAPFTPSALTRADASTQTDVKDSLRSYRTRGVASRSVESNLFDFREC